MIEKSAVTAAARAWRRRRLVAAFHRVYYGAASDGGTWQDTRWLDVQTLKCPLDLWVYQEILAASRPDVVIESGTAHGGSALFLASICDLIEHGCVITIDVNPLPGRPKHPRIEYVTGSSTDPRTVDRVRRAVGMADSVSVILDSSHARDHVRRELELFAPLVTAHQYLIVEDTNLSGYPIALRRGRGPMEAVEDFLTAHPEFVVDSTREKFLLTFNPRGYLRRTGGTNSADVHTRGAHSSGSSSTKSATRLASLATTSSAN